MFCREGPWHKLDRIWPCAPTAGTLPWRHRTMTLEIAGHELWSADGKTIWYDLQTPRGHAGYENLSAFVPVEILEIEKLMAKHRSLSDTMDH
jgi:oligogalacturonide lyase